MRTTTWENLGTEFIQGSTPTINGVPEDMIFDVERRDLGYMNSNGVFVKEKNTSTIVKVVNGKEVESYGSVSDNYGIISNEEALGVVGYIDGFECKKYGSLSNGMQFIIGSLGEMNILGDVFTPYLIFRNSFNGYYPLQMAICPLRIVCQNQLNLAFKEATNTVHIRHTKKAIERVEEAHRIMLSTNEYLTTLNAQAEKYANAKFSPTDIERIIGELFPLTPDMSDRQKETIRDRIVAFRAALMQDDLANFKNTGWGLIQAYADYQTHLEAKRSTKTVAENRFMAVTFNPRLMQALVEMVESRMLV